MNEPVEKFVLQLLLQGYKQASDYSWLDSEAARQAVDRSVIAPHNCHYNQNGWLKYDHRVINVQGVYYPLALLWYVG